MLSQGYLTIFFVERVAFDAQTEQDDEDDEDCHSKNTPATTTKRTQDQKHQNHQNHQDQVGQQQQQQRQQQQDHASAAQRSAGVLVLTLAVHSFFETMALGLSDTPLTTALMGASIGLHQVRR